MNTMNIKWPTDATGYLDAAAVIDDDGVIIHTGHREECEGKARSLSIDNTGYGYSYAVRFEGKWLHKRTFVDGETE